MGGGLWCHGRLRRVDLDLVRVWQSSVKEQVYENQRKIPFV